MNEVVSKYTQVLHLCASIMPVTYFLRLGCGDMKRDILPLIINVVEGDDGWELDLREA